MARQLKTRPTKKMKGRTSIFTQKLGVEICRRLAAGESLRGICADEGMPDESTVRAWALDNVQGFYPQYARARVIQAERWADEILEIANTPLPGVTVTTKMSKDGNMYDETRRSDMIEHRRLQVDSRKWLLSKVLPKVYGDKLTADIKADITSGDEQVSILQSAREIAFALAVAMRDGGQAPKSEKTNTRQAGRTLGHHQRRKP